MFLSAKLVTPQEKWAGSFLHVCSLPTAGQVSLCIPDVKQLGTRSRRSRQQRELVGGAKVQPETKSTSRSCFLLSERKLFNDDPVQPDDFQSLVRTLFTVCTIIFLLITKLFSGRCRRSYCFQIWFSSLACCWEQKISLQDAGLLQQKTFSQFPVKPQLHSVTNSNDLMLRSKVVPVLN